MSEGIIQYTFGWWIVYVWLYESVLASTTTKLEGLHSHFSLNKLCKSQTESRGNVSNEVWTEDPGVSGQYN